MVCWSRYEECQEIAAAKTGGSAVAGVKIGVGVVAVELSENQQAVVVWEQPAADIQ